MDDKINKYTGKVHTARYEQLQSERRKLPIWNYKQKFLDLLEKNRILVVRGEAGCGKSTQIPQWCLEYLELQGTLKGVVCTQSKRLTASEIAKQVANQMGVELGDEVGYSVRFDDHTCEKTILKYVTDGKLRREIILDPKLDRFGVVLLDEFHERSISLDLLLGMLNFSMGTRQDLKIVIMSATLDCDHLTNFLGDSVSILDVQERMFNVEVIYKENVQRRANMSILAMNEVLRIYKDPKSKKGDIIVFLTGVNEINSFCDDLETSVEKMNKKELGNLICYPLYAMLPKCDQEEAMLPLEPSNSGCHPDRKVIVATNVAETSLTIPNAVYVIDSGEVKRKYYNPTKKIYQISVIKINKSQAIQRMGRVGRTNDGECIRLYSKEHFQRMAPCFEPEITRSELTSVLLDLKKFSVVNIHDFKFLDRPAHGGLYEADKCLKNIGAFDEKSNLTSIGNMMCDFPLDAQYSRALIQSLKYRCTDMVATIVSMLSADNIFSRKWYRKGKDKKNKVSKNMDQLMKSPHGDLIRYFNVFVAYHNQKVDDRWNWCIDNKVHYENIKFSAQCKYQVMEILKKYKNGKNDFKKSCDVIENTMKCFLVAFNLNIAMLTSGRYVILRPEKSFVNIDRSSCFNHIKTAQETDEPKWLLYQHLVKAKNGALYMCDVSVIEEKWLMEVKPEIVNNFKRVFPTT